MRTNEGVLGELRHLLQGPLEWLVPFGAMLLVQRIFMPAPVGVVINGALYGGRIALIALGIALVYRANRIVNFAQGDLGGVPAVFAVMLVIGWQWNYWVGLVVGLLAALLLGGLVETLIIRRFTNAPRLVLTVATIGLAQLLTGVAFLLPQLFGKDFGSKLPAPFDFRRPIGSGPAATIFNAHDLLTAIVVPLALVGLAIFLKGSTIGLAIIGAAERPDRAAGLGIPVKRLHTVVWAVASVLAFLAMYLRAGVVGLPVGQALPVMFLVQALAAAVFGRFSRLPTIVSAALGIGILDQAVVFQSWYRPAYSNVVIFLAVMVGLLLVRRASTGRVDEDASAWQATQEVRPTPRELAGLPEIRLARWGLWVVLAAFVLTLPMWLERSELGLATLIVLFGIVAASLVVLTGWGGQVSLGHMAFVGVGAAIGGYVVEEGWDLAVAMVVAGLAGAVAAVVVGYPALRRRGLTLAVSTLAFALLTAEYLLDRTIFDWLPPTHIATPELFGSIPIDNATRVFFVSVATLLLALAMVTGVRHSRTGRVLIAIRENERAAMSYGVNVIRTQLAAFALSGFLAATAGALYVVQQEGLAPNPYAPERSLQLFTMVVIGGLGSLPGALLGATYVQGANYFLPNEWKYLASGIGLLGMLMVFPSGFGGLLALARDHWFRVVARRRGIVVASLMGERADQHSDAAVVGAAEAVEEDADAAPAPEPDDTGPPDEAGGDAGATGATAPAAKAGGAGDADGSSTEAVTA
ncbi:MAG TPA: ABC transporter permease [Acidimicrobiales bacterium]